jgi:hypothetical protein
MTCRGLGGSQGDELAGQGLKFVFGFRDLPRDRLCLPQVSPPLSLIV